MMQYMTGIVPSKPMPTAVVTAVFFVILAVLYYILFRNNVHNALLISGIIGVVGIIGVIIAYLINSSMFEGFLEQVMLHLSVSYMYSYFFETEVLDLNGIVYFVSLIGLFVFLTVQSVQKRRWS